MTLASIEETLSSLKPKYDKMLADTGPGLAGLDEDKTLQFLKGENYALRTELKRLNDFITHLVEVRKYGEFSKGQPK
jgi:hypothetical protein